jgi:hypothetical protein
MPQIDLHQLAKLVIAQIPTNAPVNVNFSEYQNGCLNFQVVGISAATSISIWSNGYCDIEYIETNSEEHTTHYEFSTASHAVETIIAELHQALNRAIPHVPFR